MCTLSQQTMHCWPLLAANHTQAHRYQLSRQSQQMPYILATTHCMASAKPQSEQLTKHACGRREEATVAGGGASACMQQPVAGS
jgi:hypothetical protein